MQRLNKMLKSRPYPHASAKSNSGPRPDLLDDFDDYYDQAAQYGGGPALLSPSITAQESMTPRTSYVKFDFPPELRSVSSSEESSGAEDNLPIVSYYGPREPESSSPKSEFSAPTSCTTLSNVIQIPQSSNPLGADSIHPKKLTMKKKRKRRTAAGAVGGMVVGGLILGPAGVFLGGATGAVATNKIHKARERRAQRKYEQKNFQKDADQSVVHRGSFA